MKSLLKSNRLNDVLETHKKYISIVLETLCYIQPIAAVPNCIIRRASCVCHFIPATQFRHYTMQNTDSCKQMNALLPGAPVGGVTVQNGAKEMRHISSPCAVLPSVKSRCVLRSWCRAPSEAHDQILGVRYLCVCRCRAPPLTRARVCHLS
jgi:hypothetical protein